MTFFRTKIASVGRTYDTQRPQGVLHNTHQRLDHRSPCHPLNRASITFYLLTMNAPHVMGAFEMKDGKPSQVYGLPFCVEFDEKGKGRWIRCRGDAPGL
jgi:hypothetical protein